MSTVATTEQASLRRAASLPVFINNRGSFVEAPEGVAKRRELILDLAVRGRLVEQDENDEPASELPENVQRERKKRLTEGTINKVKPLPEIEPDEIPFPDIPESGQWVRVTDIYDVSGGITKSPKRRPEANHFPYLRVANVRRGRLDLSEIERFELFDGELQRWRLEPGDLLVVEGNGSEHEIGRCAVWNAEIKDCVHQNHLIRCRPIAHSGQLFTLRFFNSPTGMAGV